MDTFSSMASALVPQGYDVLTFDLFGFGMSASPHKRFNSKLYVRQTLDLLALLGYPKDHKFSLVGFSMGGLVAMEIARRYAERVIRLLLVAPAGLVSLSPAEKAGIRGLRLARALRIPAASWVGLRARSNSGSSVEDFEPDVRDPELAKEAGLRNYERYNSNRAKYAKSWLKSVRDIDLSGNRKVYEGLAESKVETLFIWGDCDETTPWADVENDLRSLFPKAPVILVNGAGHGLLLECGPGVAFYAAKWFRSQRP
jgi:pimeloyl-ACP methyl ester carboxylesterase